MEYNEETKALTISHYFKEKLNIAEDTKIIIFKEEKFFKNIFNKKVDNLPQSLTHLTFGCKFNQKVNYLPKNLIYLTFGYYFNQKVDNLPKNLTYLTLGFEFNQKIDNLPKNITQLALGLYFNKKVVNLPKNIKEITLFSCNNLINNLPLHIVKVFILFDWLIRKKVENLPPTIKEIIIESKDFIKYIKKPFGTILNINKIITYKK